MVVALLDWALADAALGMRVDSDRMGVFGHSLGGKLSTMVALSCGVRSRWSPSW